MLWRNIRTPTQRGPGQWIGNNLGAASGSGVCVFIFIYINCVCIQAPTRKRPGQQFGNKLGRGAGPRYLQFATNLVAAVPPPNIRDAQSGIALVFSHCQIKDLSTPLSPKRMRVESSSDKLDSCHIATPPRGVNLIETQYIQNRLCPNIRDTLFIVEIFCPHIRKHISAQKSNSSRNCHTT